MHTALSKLAANDKLFKLLILYAALIFIAFNVLSSLMGILSPFLIGMFGAYIFNKPVKRLESIGFPRWLGALIIVLLLIITMIIISAFALPFLQKELVELAGNLPQLAQSILNRVTPFIDRVANHVSETDIASLKGQMANYIGDVLRWCLQMFINLITNGMVLANVLSLVILTPVIMFYLLKDWPTIVETVSNYIKAKKTRAVIKEIDKSLIAYAHGQALVCLILMILYSLALSISGLRHAIMIGVMTGFFSFIPYLGALMGFLVSLSVAFSQFPQWHQILLMVGIFLLISGIEGNYLTPKFLGSKIGLHPVWIIFSLLAGATWLGFMGVILALPTATVIAAIVRVSLRSHPVLEV